MLIDNIRKQLDCLPPKDKKLCEQFLDKREFVKILEIVNSDLYKQRKKLSACSPLTDLEVSDQYTVEEEIYSKMKILQQVVSDQAEAFLEDADDFNDDYYDLM